MIILFIRIKVQSVHGGEMVVYLQQKSAVVSSAAAQEETDGRPLPPGWRSYTSPEGQRYYVNSCSKGEVSHLNTKSNTNNTSWVHTGTDAVFHCQRSTSVVL